MSRPHSCRLLSTKDLMNNACVKMSHGNPRRMYTIQFLLPLKQNKNDLRIGSFGRNRHEILKSYRRYECNECQQDLGRFWINPDFQHPWTVHRALTLKPHSHCADVATVHPDAGQPVYRDAPGHIS